MELWSLCKRRKKWTQEREKEKSGKNRREGIILEAQVSKVEKDCWGQ